MARPRTIARPRIARTARRSTGFLIAVIGLLACSVSSYAQDGACCLPDGTCITVASGAECAALGGITLGPGSTCEECQSAVGACCFQMSGTTCDDLSPSACIVAGGFFVGPGTVCADGSCVDPEVGLCCLPNGDCATTIEFICEFHLAGTWLGADGMCSDCIQPTGACCTSDGGCSISTESECMTFPFGSDIWLGPGTTCADCQTVELPCCLPAGGCELLSMSDCDAAGGTTVTQCSSCNLLGACCAPDGTCTLTEQLGCPSFSGNLFLGVGSTCLDCTKTVRPCCVPDGGCELLTAGECGTIDGLLVGDCADCANTGACCFADGSCQITLADFMSGSFTCEAFLGGTFAGAGSICTECCLADLDGDGVVGFSDLTQLLGAWGPCAPFPESCLEDINQDGLVGLVDLTILLADWGPCPGS